MKANIRTIRVEVDPTIDSDHRGLRESIDLQAACLLTQSSLRRQYIPETYLVATGDDGGGF
jgi:hypothetical protein